jgi:hypothetical protein
MGNYLLAYRGGKVAVSGEERDSQMAAWGEWFGRLGEAVVDIGNPFAGSASIATDGTVSEGAPSRLGGYSVVEADSLAQATALAGDCPILGTGGTVDIYETIVVV